MRRSFTRAVVIALLLFLPSVKAAPLIYKCNISGAITYQSDPCRSGKPTKRPTVEQLNAERKKSLQQAAQATQNRSEPTRSGQLAPSTGAISGVPVPNDLSLRGSTAAQTGSPTLSFHCDGRTYCSQMTSCAEAKSFLALCPGVKMDGDGNGIPCERQWCSR